MIYYSWLNGNKNYLADTVPDELGAFIDFCQNKRAEIKKNFQDKKRLDLLKKMSDKQAFVLLADHGLEAAQNYLNKVIEENV